MYYLIDRSQGDILAQADTVSGVIDAFRNSGEYDLIDFLDGDIISDLAIVQDTHYTVQIKAEISVEPNVLYSSEGHSGGGFTNG